MTLDTIVARAKRKWFVYPNSEIYWWLANTRDYGPYGSLLRKNIYDLWRKHFVQQRSDIVGMDTTILAHPTTRQASWHLEWFSDALIDDKKTGQRFRADKLIEESILQKIARFWSEWSVQEYIIQTYWFANLSPEARWNEWMHQYITGEKIKNPSNNKDADWTNVRQFNLMLSTHLWPVSDDTNKIYLRPETCQSLFTNFKNICDTTRARIPFGLAQIGKAFRNEITPWQFMYRTREFEQMEIEYFVPADPDIAAEIYDKRKQDSMEYWTQIIGIDPSHLRFKDHDKLAHYAAAATDIEYLFPRWFGEVQGIHNRTDFDLRQHQEYSKKDMQYNDPKSWKRYIPRCIESSMGLGRQVMVAMLEFYDEEIVWEWDTRIVARFPFDLAPIKIAILPLIDKDEMMNAESNILTRQLQKYRTVECDGGWSIWKRYRRQDEIGTPYCITIDHQTRDDMTVTIRHRDTMLQERILMSKVVDYINAVTQK